MILQITSHNATIYCQNLTIPFDVLFANFSLTKLGSTPDSETSELVSNARPCTFPINSDIFFLIMTIIKEDANM